MKKFLAIILAFSLFISIPSKPITASTITAPYEKTNVLKEGIYKVSEKSSTFKPGEYRFEMISTTGRAYIFIIDSETVLRYSKRFNNTESPFTVGTLLEGDSIIIYGDGEFYFNKLK
ncbi:hypothetical protein [Clostridium sp.]|uniref:hypothetical protein n=1 Tax=Clostridium sp. TaxID=1506 RepID=UPI003F2BD5D0